MSEVIHISSGQGSYNGKKVGHILCQGKKYFDLDDWVHHKSFYVATCKKCALEKLKYYMARGREDDAYYVCLRFKLKKSQAYEI